MTHLPTEFPDFGLTPEERREAVRGHYYEYPGMDGARGEIWCYTDRFSYARRRRRSTCMSARRPRPATWRSCATAAARRRVYAQRRHRHATGRTRPTSARSTAAAGSRPSTFPIPARLAVRRLSHHADRRGPRRRADHAATTSSSSCPDAGTRSPAASCRSPRPAPGPPTTPGAARTTTRASPARTATSSRPRVSIERPLVPRLRRAAAGCAARAAGDRRLPPATVAALSAYGMGLCHRPFEEIHLVRLGEL